MLMSAFERIGHLPRDVSASSTPSCRSRPRRCPRVSPSTYGMVYQSVAAAPCDRSAIENRQYVGMLEAGGKPDLAKETLGHERSGDFGVQDLERHKPVVPEVMRQIYRGHSPPPELAIEPVVIGECRLQEILIGQVTSSDRGCLHDTAWPWNRHPCGVVSL